MLYADVIVRKSTAAQALTYAVPASILPYISVGSLVKVPLRRQSTSGVVMALKSRPPKELTATRPITSIEKKQQFTQQQIQLTTALAKRHGASLAETARFSLRFPAQGQDKNSISSKSTQTLFVSGDWQTRVAAYKKIISQNLSYAFLLIFPSQALAELFYSSLAADQRAISLLLKKDSDPKKNTSSARIIIGTIGQIFLPLSPNDILIVDSPDYLGCRFQQRPYLLGREIALVRHKYEKIRLCFGQTLPKAESLINSWRFLNLTRPRPLTIVAERIRELDPVLMDELGSLARRNKKALLVVGRSGWGEVGYCSQCRRVVRCPNCQRPMGLESGKMHCRWCRTSPQFIDCPDCRGSVRGLGWGVAKLANQLSQQLDTPVRPWTGSFPALGREKIVVATEKALTQPDLFWEMIVVWGDHLLTGSDIDNPWRLMSLMLQLASQTKRLVARTSFPDHPIWEGLARGQCQTILQQELPQRRQLFLPPFGLTFSLKKAEIKTITSSEIECITSLVSKELPEAIVKDVGSSELEIFLPKVGTAFLDNLRLVLPPAWHIAIH